MKMRKPLLLSANTKERSPRISSAENITQPNAQMDSKRLARMAQQICPEEAEKERDVEKAREKGKAKEKVRIKGEIEAEVKTKAEIKAKEKEEVRATEDRRILATSFKTIQSKALQKSLFFHNGVKPLLEKE